MQLTFETQGIAILGLTGYLLVYDPDKAAIAATTDAELMNVLADKVDPAVLEAASQAANTLTDVANHIS